MARTFRVVGGSGQHWLVHLFLFHYRWGYSLHTFFFVSKTAHLSIFIVYCEYDDNLLILVVPWVYVPAFLLPTLTTGGVILLYEYSNCSLNTPWTIPLDTFISLPSHLVFNFGSPSTRSEISLSASGTITNRYLPQSIVLWVNWSVFRRRFSTAANVRNNFFLGCPKGLIML